MDLESFLSSVRIRQMPAGIQRKEQSIATKKTTLKL